MQSRGTIRDILIFLTFLGVLILVFNVLGLGITKEASASETLQRDVLAIASVPEQAHDNVTLEGSAYYSDGDEIFTVGAGFGVAGVSVGAAIAYDQNDMYSHMPEEDYSVAVGAGLKVGNYADLRIGAASDGVGKPDTFGATLRFGF